ncbi:MAG: GNAT family N-acetyltransferase [Flavobacteriaceae bacterium]|nr:GNAT family N-acetyltransferase [Flavobacteriaceae bacterium]
MQSLKNKNITLRALEAEDLNFLFSIENNENFWEVSHTQTPFSKYVLKLYLENSHLDIYETKQLRLVIVENISEKAIGLIDLFDFNPQHKRAGIGILIEQNHRKKGYASEALASLIQYTFTHLDLHQLYCNILVDNIESIGLFKKHNFSKIGVKKDWIYNNKTFKDEVLFQLIK